MNQQPIRRKHSNYPIDFLPPEKRNKQEKRYTVNQGYQIEAHSIHKYEKSMEEGHNLCPNCSRVTTTVANPQKTVLSTTEIQQDYPLEHHLFGKKPSLDQDLLKKPRFSINQKQQIQEKGGNTLQNSMSPGHIVKQMRNRQAPLPAQDPCKIEHLRASPVRNKKIPNTYLKYSSTGQFSNKRWVSSQKDILQKYKGCRSRVEQLPAVNKKSTQNEMHFAAAKEQYDLFRLRQQSMNGRFGKMNSILNSVKNKDISSTTSQFHSYDKTALQRLKDDINTTVRNKKGFKKQQSQPSQSSQEQVQKNHHISQKNHHVNKKNRKLHFNNRALQENRPQLLVSYRSSLSYLKDLFNKSLNLQHYHLVVKIPKLFNQNLIQKGQDKDDLYQTARSIFYQLKIPHQNLVIKKYTNCTMLIARNICMIWHFDGRRFLGGWQSQYLDQGFKHGLGLEWQPKKYVYYGEYVKNKKHGLGVYKDRTGLNYIGYWNKGHRCDIKQLNTSAIDEQNQYYSTESSNQNGQSNVYQYL